LTIPPTYVVSTTGIDLDCRCREETTTKPPEGWVRPSDRELGRGESKRKDVKDVGKVTASGQDGERESSLGTFR
jgi:hypothetical protein